MADCTRHLGCLDALNNSSILPILFMVAHWLCYLNSATNPLIYNFMSVKFKKEFRNVFSCSRRQSRTYNDSTLFHSTRMVRQPKQQHLHHHYQPADSNLSEHSSSNMLRAHDVVPSLYSNHRIYNGHRMVDGPDLPDGHSV
ncbi:allatotropin receptor [Plakobranchus ocellatus]|uniref:Allatotropin receptor n=1 Tax=Plakobranchus ocellatus TaxID=259542 RepID=A0AAV4ASF9_9GAST|nr:allatotropin receptor [Plakobranchus ocellatus]